MEFESKSTMPSALSPPSKMKYLGINLIKYIQELHEKNYKDPMNEIKELNKWRAISCLWLGRLNIVKMPVFPNLI